MFVCFIRNIGELRHSTGKAQRWCPLFSIPSENISKCQTQCLYLKPKLQGQQSGLSFTERVNMCFSLLSVQCLGCGRAKNSLIVIIPYHPKMKTPVATRARWFKDIPWAAALKTGEPNLKIMALALCKNTPLENTETLELGPSSAVSKGWQPLDVSVYM